MCTLLTGCTVKRVHIIAEAVCHPYEACIFRLIQFIKCSDSQDQIVKTPSAEAIELMRMIRIAIGQNHFTRNE
jgi:hypothetical protein